ncbi:ABC transporter ATP-binding protein [Paenibacillus yanchengensis]|uniref:ABC transporter ATP-binding protein n=1 Tax=Paenibacillus yanchengensis TaxID=2035833 RepID=A0ABW4YPN8_9BACL
MLEKLKEPFRYPKVALKDKQTVRAKAGGKAKKKPTQTGKTLLRLWAYLARYRGKLIAVLVMVICSTVFSILGPYLTGTAINLFIEKQQSGFATFLFIIGGVYLLQAITTWLHNIWMINISQQIVFQMRQDLFRYLHRLPIPYFSKRQHGEMMSRMTNDIDNISSSLNSSIIQILSSTLMLSGIVVIMLSISPLLTLLTFIIVPLMFSGMKWITNRTSYMFKEQQQNLGELNGFIEETLSGQRIVKAFSQEDKVKQGFATRNEKIKLSGFWAQTLSGFIPKLMNGLNNLSFAIIAGVGGILAIKGNAITVGAIYIFAEYARQFTRPLNDLANQWNMMLSAVAGAERVFQVLDEPVEEADEEQAITLAQVQGCVQFKDVSFSYKANDNTIQGVNFTAQPGETVAFIGPTGAGKTTLIQLLCRFYDPSAGKILLDGTNITSVKRESLRQHTAFVLQDPFLFAGTIRENIRYGRLEATDQEVEEAAKQANAHSFIIRMKQGYETELILDGGGISQGQKQLIAIARAILANPSLLVLDEATSSIDTVTEIKIQEALHRLMQGRTSFVIAHRLNTIQQADQIVVLQQGKVTEKGSHEQLVENNGFYTQLVNGQFELE